LKIKEESLAGIWEHFEKSGNGLLLLDDYCSCRFSFLVKNMVFVSVPLKTGKMHASLRF